MQLRQRAQQPLGPIPGRYAIACRELRDPREPMLGEERLDICAHRCVVVLHGEEADAILIKWESPEDGEFGPLGIQAPVVDDGRRPVLAEDGPGRAGLLADRYYPSA